MCIRDRPMRVIDIEGKVESEITRIIKTARVEPHNYVLPKDYKPVSAAEKIEELLSDNAQTEKQPKKSTPIPPRAMERVRYYQEMMRQR